MDAAEFNSIDTTRRTQSVPADSILLGPGASLSTPYYDMRPAEEPPSANVVTSALHAFRRRWFSIVVLGLILGGLAASAFWFLTTTQYTAVARVVVPAQEHAFPGSVDEGAPQG